MLAGFFIAKTEWFVDNRITYTKIVQFVSKYLNYLFRKVFKKICRMVSNDEKRDCIYSTWE